MAAVAATFSGCGLFEGYAVDSYLKKVARIQQESDESLMNLDQDLIALGGDQKAVEATVLQLRADGEAVAAARMELEALEAPEAAAPFKSHLLEVYTEGGSLLEELIRTGEYRLAIEPLINQYEASSGSFSENVKSASDREAVISCLRIYEGSITDIADKAQILQPPLLSSSSHKRFIANLNTVGEGLTGTISGLESEDAALLEAASSRMAGSGEMSEGLHQQIISEREADIRSFNAKIQEMTELWQHVVQDQLTLREQFARN